MTDNKNIKKTRKRKSQKDRKPVYEIYSVAITIPEESMEEILRNMSEPFEEDK